MIFSISSVCEVFEGQSTVIAMLESRRPVNSLTQNDVCFKRRKAEILQIFFIINKQTSDAFKKGK